jgi:AraC-like DNA-binding protein
MSLHPDDVSRSLLEPVPAGPREGVPQVVHAFSTEFTRIHPASAASRVARLIGLEYHLQWSLATLGRRFHVTPSQLRRGFEREFGVSIHKYQEEMRVRAAIEHVRNDNMEATALGAGFKGKKNFYRAFRQVTGLTPTSFRLLSDERAAHHRIPRRHTAQAGRRRGPTTLRAVKRHRAPRLAEGSRVAIFLFVLFVCSWVS